MYFLSSDFTINAIYIETGITPGKKIHYYPGPRGYLINQEDNESYLYITSDRRLFKINSKTGKLDKKFGLNGSIDVGFIQSAPVVYKDQIILLETDKKQILSYHLKNGKLNYKDTIQIKITIILLWSGIGLDSDTGYIYFVTGNQNQLWCP